MTVWSQSLGLQSKSHFEKVCLKLFLLLGLFSDTEGWVSTILSSTMKSEKPLKFEYYDWSSVYSWTTTIVSRAQLKIMTRYQMVNLFLMAWQLWWWQQCVCDHLILTVNQWYLHASYNILSLLSSTPNIKTEDYPFSNLAKSTEGIVEKLLLALSQWNSRLIIYDWVADCQGCCWATFSSLIWSVKTSEPQSIKQ